MGEYSELVKRLNEILQADLAETGGPTKGSISMLAVMPFPQFDRIADERREAAQVIERLERKLETVSTLDKNTIARRTDRITALEAELADARAEIERKDKALERIAYETAATWVADIAHEALATQASTDNPSGEG